MVLRRPNKGRGVNRLIQKDTSTYDITIRYSAAQNGGQLQIDFGGDDKTGVVSLPSTGSVNVINETVIARGVRLSAGVQSMRVFVRGNSNVINMDSILIN